MLRNVITRLYAAEGGGSGTGDQGDDPPEGKVKPSDILARYGQTAESALRMAEKLAESENANYHLRDKNRTLRSERDDLKSKTPGDGTRVLSADEAKAFDAYLALGKPPAEIKQALEASGEATAKLTKLERDAQIRDAALAHGYSPAALGKLPSLANAALLLKDETIDDKMVKRAYVTADGKETALDAYIQQHDPEFLPSLNVEAQQIQQQQQTRGTSFVQQHAGGSGAPPANAGQAYINRRYNKKDK
jgi:hypothetical protein